jgi:dTDP-4-amino-4,6-dideoxygalactose transaminase
VGAPCVVVTSGTAALHCAFYAIDLKPGDEVITPPLTFIATQATATFFGAKIVFADVLDDTGNINPVEVEKNITSRTKAIVAVDYAGHPADLNELQRIAEKYQLFLIEDAAHSIGSKYHGKPVGSIADLTTFSFFPTKNMTTGEGGAISSNNPELLARVRRFSRQGIVRDPSQFKIRGEGKWHQEIHEFGLNYRLPDILCALGISQLARLNEFKSRRREIFTLYSSILSADTRIKLPIERPLIESNWHLFPIRVPSEFREMLFDHLRESGIGVQVNYLPAHKQPVFRTREYQDIDLPVAENFYSREISIPMHFNLTNNDVDRIGKTILRKMQEI